LCTLLNSVLVPECGMQYQQAFQRIGDSQLFPNMENSSVLV